MVDTVHPATGQSTRSPDILHALVALLDVPITRTPRLREILKSFLGRLVRADRHILNVRPVTPAAHRAPHHMKPSDALARFDD